ncbi:hypothetical protein B0F90DRAFT_1670983 [Multifurca ochricompacta]|uniref:Uncharacterized protein n=1 Tax=Multifurca ochricompacta TaxID=376703 RepID=A0AAD4QG51_9AGAM|nr:hypothetical protein B0F90DRAFT_1670983 [Multifurca ochricompacta]
MLDAGTHAPNEDNVSNVGLDPPSWQRLVRGTLAALIRDDPGAPGLDATSIHPDNPVVNTPREHIYSMLQHLVDLYAPTNSASRTAEFEQIRRNFHARLTAATEAQTKRQFLVAGTDQKIRQELEQELRATIRHDLESQRDALTEDVRRVMRDEISRDITTWRVMYREERP